MHTTKSVSLVEAVNLAKVVFGLTTPFELVELKKAFRRESRILHPDVGGTKEAFQEMSRAYQILSGMQREKALFLNGVDWSIDQLEAVTTDGTPLSSLGLGLGPTINSEDCKQCHHDGYITHTGRHLVRCNQCDDNGRMIMKVACKACEGTGEFTQRRTRRVVDCKVCKGTGTFTHPRLKVFCTACLGTRTRYVDDGKPYHLKCFHCDGTGEVRIFNPVIPKSAVLF